jgi:hypothetical protein
MSSTSNEEYYVPHGTHWPIIGSIGLTLTVVGIANFLHGTWSATPIFVGLAVLFFMMYGWFGQVITESLNGFYNNQVDTTFRWSMSWFIFSVLRRLLRRAVLRTPVLDSVARRWFQQRRDRTVPVAGLRSGLAVAVGTGEREVRGC